MSEYDPELPTRCRAEAESVRPVFPSIADALDLAAAEIDRCRALISDLIGTPVSMDELREHVRQRLADRKETA